MPRIKIASFNVEWMVNLFKRGQAAFWPDKSKSRGLGRKPKNVPVVCGRIAGVIKDMKADIIGIEEGPPQKQQMQLFVKDHLDDEYEVYSMPDGSQSNHALVRKGLNLHIKQMPGSHPIYKHLSRKVEYYTWGEVKKARLDKFTRKPVVLRLTREGKSIEIMVFHTKSKISRLKRKKQWTTRDKPVIVDALRSRQKLSAEMAAIRRYLTHAVLSRRAAGCILMGDLNDGPHRDVFEERFLIHNIVDELRGGFHRETALMHHGLPQDQLVGKNAFTAKFSDPTRDGKTVKVLLDHILVSDALLDGSAPLRLVAGKGRIEHTVFEKHLKGSGRNADDRPSDHRPVSAVFSYT
ncbi:MAG: endonuclease/exonuclease/phosphatase family protein [Candidatus Methylomirabilales bacterium]